MTDRRLRELERRWRETGAVEDEAALLRERLRAGALPPERLDLAVYLEHPAALLVAGPEPAAPQELRAWVEGLERWGKEVLVRAALAAARAVLPVYAREHPQDDRPRALVLAAEAWLRRPGEETLARAGVLHRDAREAGFPRARYAWAAVSVLEVVRADLDPALSPPPAAPPRTARQLAVQAVVQAADPLWTAEGLGPEAVRAAIRRELSAWALGQDPP